MTKRCSKCAAEKDRALFAVRKDNKDGLQGVCRACVAEYRKESYAKNKEKIAASRKAHYSANKAAYAARGKAYREANKEKIAKRNRAYVEANREKTVARQRRWHAANKERIAETARVYREANKEKIAEYNKLYYEKHGTVATNAAWAKAHPERKRAAAARRRARKLGQFVESVDPQVCFDMHGGRCGICKEFIEGDFHVDHRIPLSKGGMHGYVNCQPAHPVCNLRKGSKLPDQLRSSPSLIEHTASI